MKFHVKTVLKFAVLAAISAVVLLSSAAFAEAPAKCTKDGNTITCDTKDARYCELFLISGQPGHLSADFYNTLGLDTCDPEKLKAIDGPAEAEKFGAHALFKNGPRFFVCDRTVVILGGSEDMFSKTVDFGGIKARFSGHVILPPDFGKSKTSVAYQPTIVHRNTQWVYLKGSKIFILDDPDGHPWIMQASAAIVDSKLTPKQLPKLGSVLKPAPGWKYRVVTLDKDLTVQPVNGTAKIVQDELQNTYDLCFETGCSWTP